MSEEITTIEAPAVITRINTIPSVDEIIERYDSMKTARAPLDPIFQDIRELVRPSASDFTGTASLDSERTERIYDDTPAYALGVFGAGIHSYMTNPAARFFEVTNRNYALSIRPRVLSWMEGVSDIIYNEMRNPDGQYNAMMHELWLELGSFGTGVISSMWNKKVGEMRFRTWPLADCFIDENDEGLVDVVFRRARMTTRQARSYFGELCPEKIAEEKDLQRVWEFVYAVFPRTDRDPRNYTSKHMPFAAVWVSVETKDLINESGYRDFPYQVPRWEKLAGQVYGRSPAMLCLKKIRVLNACVKVLLQSSQLQAAPPLLVEDENVIGGIKLQPYSLIYTSPGAENAVRPLVTGGNISINIDLVNQLKNEIMRCFFNDLFKVRDNSGRDRVTAVEIMETRDDGLRQLAPISSRLECELLNRQIKRIYGYLSENNRIPEAPPELNGDSGLDIRYISPAALAQRGVKAANMQRLLADLVPIGQVKQDIFDILDFDVIGQDYALARNVSRNAIRNPETVQQVRQARNQQQQLLQAAQAAPQVAGAIKDLATAGKDAPNIASIFG